VGGDVGRGGFPWPTLLVNVSGAFILGLVYTLLGERVRPTPYLRTLLAIGFLGACTTLSTFTFESVRLVESGAVLIGLANIVLSTVAGLAAAGAGLALGGVA
jgi:CrcB protein